MQPWFAKSLVCIPFVCLFSDRLPAQLRNQPGPGNEMQKMFEQFSSQANKFVPGMMGEMSPEQKARLDKIVITPAEEAQAGKKAIASFLDHAAKQNWKVSSDGKDVSYLKELVKKIRPSMKNSARYDNIEIRVVETNATDAYSFAGGYLVFTTGLLESIGSEAALVGVVGHELSHLDRGHLLMPLKQAKMTNQPTNPMDGMMMVAMFARPFRPEQESEADADAVLWMMKAGYQPTELARMLNQWDTKQAQTTPWMDFVPGFVKTHPDPGKRALQVLELAKSNQVRYPKADFIGRDELEKRQARKAKQKGN